MSMLPPFQSFLEAHRAMLFRFLVARVGPQAAEDCFQEALLAALRAYPSLPTTTNLKTWALTIADRKAIDYYRAEGRRRSAPSASAKVAPASDGYDPALWEAVRSLPEKQRASVVYRFVADLPYAEIGQLTESSEAAARQNVRAGLSALRKVWTQ